jgi:uncharacterized membrane protein
MNGLFFTDDSMHKATKSTDYSFVQQLPKIIFSLIGTHIIEVFLCYLSMTDTVMYEVKDLTKRKHTEQVIAEKINTMKKKLIAYFIVTLLLFAFYWYFLYFRSYASVPFLSGHCRWGDIQCEFHFVLLSWRRSAF